MKLAVQHDAVGHTIARLALTVRNLDDELRRLDEEVRKLQEAWDGEARQSYDRAQARWSASIRQMKALLAEGTRRLTTANAISMETSAAAARVWS